jgi:hypothetical protein
MAIKHHSKLLLLLLQQLLLIAEATAGWCHTRPW